MMVNLPNSWTSSAGVQTKCQASMSLGARLPCRTKVPPPSRSRVSEGERERERTKLACTYQRVGKGRGSHGKGWEGKLGKLGQGSLGSGGGKGDGVVVRREGGNPMGSSIYICGGSLLEGKGVFIFSLGFIAVQNSACENFCLWRSGGLCRNVWPGWAKQIVYIAGTCAFPSFFPPSTVLSCSPPLSASPQPSGKLPEPLPSLPKLWQAWLTLIPLQP